MLTLLMFHTSIKWTFTQLQKKSTYQINAIKKLSQFFPSNNNSNHRFYRYFKCLLGFFTKLSMVHCLCADVRDLRVPTYFLCFLREYKFFRSLFCIRISYSRQNLQKYIWISKCVRLSKEKF